MKSEQWELVVFGAENCMHVHDLSLCLSFLEHQALPVVPSPSGLIAKAAVLHSASENRHSGLVLRYAIYLFGKYGCKLCFYILKKGFILKNLHGDFFFFF